MMKWFLRHDFRGCAVFFSMALSLSLSAQDAPAHPASRPLQSMQVAPVTPPAAPAAPVAPVVPGRTPKPVVVAETGEASVGGAREDGFSSGRLMDDEVSGRLIRVVLVPRREAMLSAETTGKILKIGYQLGGSFKEGEELLTVEDTFFLAALDKAKAVAKAAETTLKSLLELRTRNDASVMEIENARRDVAAAQAEIALAKRNLSACHLVAPYAGRVAELFVNEFELIEPGRPFLRIIDDGVLLGHVYLPGALYPLVQPGRRVPVLIVRGRLPGAASAASGKGVAMPADVGGAAEREMVDGEFCRVSPVIDPASGMFEAYVQIDNSAGRFRAGMEAWLCAEDLHGR